MKTQISDLDKQIALIYPIADVLNIRLGLHTPLNKRHRIVNLVYDVPKYKLADAIAIAPEMTIKASYVDTSTAAVLVRVLGDFYIYLVYDNKLGQYILYVLDADKLPMTSKVIEQLDGEPPKQAYNVVSTALKGLYTKTYQAETWDRLELTDAATLDFG